jgi:hypothetical protein
MQRNRTPGHRAGTKYRRLKLINKVNFHLLLRYIIAYLQPEHPGLTDVTIVDLQISSLSQATIMSSNVYDFIVVGG